MKTRRPNFLLRCLISAVLIGFVVHKVNWSALFVVLGQVRFRWVLAGSGLYPFFIMGLAFRWRIFLGAQSIDLPFGKILSLTWGGQFFNAMLPGSTGGDVVKIYQLCRLVPDRKAAAASTVFVDRLTALTALVVLAAIGLAIDPAPFSFLSPGPISIWSLFYWALLGLLGVALAAWLFWRLTRTTFWGGRLFRTLAAVKMGLKPSPGLVAGVSLAFAMHVLNFVMVYLFSQALGMSVTFLQIFAMMPVVILFIMLPVTINGHGLRELLLIGYLSNMGITVHGDPGAGVREIAVAFSLIQVSNDLLWSIPGGLWYMIRFKSRPMPSAADKLISEGNV